MTQMRVDNSIADAVPANGILAFGHAISTAFHVAALYFGLAYLLITIAVHLIYTAVALAKQDGAPRIRTNVANVARDGSLP